MLVGHLAVGFAGKHLDPRLSLGTLMLAAMLADLVCGVLMLAGVEEVRFKPGTGAANYLDAVDIGWSHSLLMGGVWGALLAGVHLARRRQPRGAALLFAAVVSHWLLDAASHRPDMPLIPGGTSRVGLGLWASVPWTLLVEGSLWLLAIHLYTRVTRPKTAAGTHAFWAVIGLATLAWYNNIAGPPPPNPGAVPFASLGLFSLLLAWAYWMDRVRPSHTA
jgi:hypothetical protein